MKKLGLTRIVISVPRLLVIAVVLGAALGSVQLIAPTQKTQSLQPETTSEKTSIPYTTASPAVTQTSPAAVPETETVAPKPTVSTPITHSAKPAPVVTPAPSASVSGLAPVSPTSTPSTPSSSSSSAGGGSTSSSTSPPATTTSYTSTNWSGYFASTSKYTGISGTWTVPKITTGDTRASADATWLGIGGVTSGDLIQVGTSDTVSIAGHQNASAFYELLPNVSQTIPSLNISPGDVMSASLNEVSTGQWKISISDISTGQTYTNTVAYSSSDSSVEWIEEDPSNSSDRLLPLDNFGSVTFSNATATTTSGTITPATSDAEPITMISTTTGDSLVVPSALSSGGNGFTVTQQP